MYWYRLKLYYRSYLGVIAIMTIDFYRLLKYSGLSSTIIKLKILYGHHVTSHFIKIVTPIYIFLQF
jgi:hypothetical protein